MDDERKLIEKLLRIEALFARAGTDGEKMAAASAADRLRQRLAEFERSDPPIEYRFATPDPWSRQLLLALLRRYGIRTYRYPNQRRTTVMARVSRRFVDETLWPEFTQINDTLHKYLAEVTARVISTAIFPDMGDEEVRSEGALGAGPEGGPR